MPPDDGGLEQLERLLRETPEARIVWTQAGRILNLNALPGYGHGLLRALSLRHAGLLFTLTQDPPAPADVTTARTNHLYDPGGAFSREWRALLEARVGHFTAGNDASPATPAAYAGRTRAFFRQNGPREYQPRRRKAHRLPERMAAPHEPALEALIHEIPPYPLHPARRHGDNADPRD